MRHVIASFREPFIKPMGLARREESRLSLGY